MAKFYYRGVTRTKEEVNGVLEAQDEVEARLRLRAIQVRPLSLTDAPPGPLFKMPNFKDMQFGSPIDLKGMVVFTRQFSSLVDSGVPIVQCLDILFAQERRLGFKKILARVKADIEGGSSLADALGKHPKVFGEFFVRIVEAGELSGTLDTALRRVGAQLEKLGKLKSKVIGALMYPCITLVVAMVVLVFLLVKVIPEVAKLYTESNAKLPEITVTVLAMSKWFQENYYFLVVGFGGMIFGSIALYRLEQVREVWDPIVLRLPLFGTLIQKSAVARFARTMSTLIASGVPLLSGFDICQKLIGNKAIKRTIKEASVAVTEGKSIAAGLATRGLFPPMVTHMVNIGEMTGKLDELLGKVADIYDDEVDDAIGNLTGLLQPLMIVVVGIIVAFLLLSMYMPIFQLAEKATGGA